MSKPHGRSSSASSTPVKHNGKAASSTAALPQTPALLATPDDRDAWKASWAALGQPWRTEPEIDQKRQTELAERRAIVPDVKQGVYPFKGMKLSRADIEWLLATHENGRGPVDWSDESQRERMGLDLRGADLREIDLKGLPLARMRGGITSQERAVTTRPQRNMASAHLERTNFLQAHLEGTMLRLAHLEGANLESAYLEGADCGGAHLEGAYLCRAYLDGVYLRRAFFDASTFLDEVSLGNEKRGFVSLVDVSWSGANLATVHWPEMMMPGDEQKARRRRTDTGQLKDKATRLFEHESAVRANRQLGTVLQGQGLNEEAARFAYRA